jgi:hypothetical protein
LNQLTGGKNNEAGLKQLEFNKKIQSAKMNSIYIQVAEDLEQSVLSSSQSSNEFSRSMLVDEIKNDSRATAIKEQKRNFFYKNSEMPRAKNVNIKRVTIGKSLAYGSNDLTLGSVPGNQRKDLDLQRIVDDQVNKKRFFFNFICS